MGLFSTSGGRNRVLAGIRKRARAFAGIENFQKVFGELRGTIRQSIASGLGPQFQIDAAQRLARSGLGQGSVIGRQITSAIEGAPEFFATERALPATQQFTGQQVQTELGLIQAAPPQQSSLFSNIAQVAGTVFPAIGVAQSLIGSAGLASAAGPRNNASQGGALSFAKNPLAGLAP